MFQRTQTYLDWAAVHANFNSKELKLPNGTQVDVRARTLDDGTKQLFVGVYTGAGKPIVEDYTDNVLGMTIDQALDWGIDRGLSVGNGQKPE